MCLSPVYIGQKIHFWQICGIHTPFTFLPTHRQSLKFPLNLNVHVFGLWEEIRVPLHIWLHEDRPSVQLGFKPETLLLCGDSSVYQSSVTNLVLSNQVNRVEAYLHALSVVVWSNSNKSIILQIFNHVKHHNPGQKWLLHYS